MHAHLFQLFLQQTSSKLSSFNVETHLGIAQHELLSLIEIQLCSCGFRQLEVHEEMSQGHLHLNHCKPLSNAESVASLKNETLLI